MPIHKNSSIPKIVKKLLVIQYAIFRGKPKMNNRILENFTSHA